jgi:hypothetical protein
MPLASHERPCNEPNCPIRESLHLEMRECGKRQSDHGALDHDYRGQDSEVQLRELREYVERRGWQLTEIYTDSVSGTKNSRPGLDKLMSDAARRRFDVVVVWRFDRFARSVSHLLRALEQFQALGIDFISLSEDGVAYDENRYLATLAKRGSPLIPVPAVAAPSL